MPKILTNTKKEPVQQRVGTPVDTACVLSYKEYADQRKSETVDFKTIQTLTDSFKTRISDPLGRLNPDIEMGEYFVIPINELKELINTCPDAEFVHIYNALRDTRNTAGQNKTFPVTVIVPIIKTKNESGNDVYAPSNDASATYIESYPCPPDPNCPKAGMIGIILKEGTQLNDFKSLF
jgi:hypothetical protein